MQRDMGSASAHNAGMQSKRTHSRCTQREHAAQVMRTRRRGDGVLYVPPGCFVHPKTQAFWLGGASEGQRAQGQ